MAVRNTCSIHEEVGAVIHVVIHHCHLYHRQQSRGHVIKVIESNLPLPDGCIAIIAVVVLGTIACEGHSLNALASVLYIRAINLLHCNMDITTAVLDTVACKSDSLNALASVLYVRAINFMHHDMGIAFDVLGNVACASDCFNALAPGLSMRAIKLLPCTHELLQLDQSIIAW